MYAATWRGRPVAVKELKVETEGEGAQSMRDFQLEVAVLLGLQCPYITRVLCAVSDRQAYVMELCEKGPLSLHLVRDDVRLDWKQRHVWMEQIATGVQYLHSLKPKIIHRDLVRDCVGVVVVLFSHFPPL